MTRRLVLTAVPQIGAGQGKVPTDEGALNEFAAAYNDYVKALAAGTLDIRAWRRVHKLWKDLVD